MPHVNHPSTLNDGGCSTCQFDGHCECVVLQNNFECLFNVAQEKNYEEILDQNEIFVYPRVNAVRTELENHPHVKFIEAPLVEISSSFIREALRQKKDVGYMMPEKVRDLIDEKNFYQR